MTDKTPDSPSLSYRDAGVDIDAGNQLIDRIKPIAARTRREGMLDDLGGFGALFEIPAHYCQPVLVSGTDGVGTKLKLAIDTGIHDSIGIDLVAMCVNDLLVQGAEPLFFLDYYATGRLQLDTAESVIKGIGKGCELAGVALIGGETAEMPGMYHGEDYDLAGFCVGVVEKDRIISGRNVKPGNVLLGIASSGPHSNGYSLIRKIIEVSNADLDSDFDGRPLGTVLLEPTRIYVKPLLKLIKKLPVLAMAHITGGGLLENIPRVLPKDVHAVIDTGSWIRSAVFDWLQDNGGVEESEMYRIFNCGIGMVICVDETNAESALSLLSSEGETAWRIGTIEASHDENEPVVLK